MTLPSSEPKPELDEVWPVPHLQISYDSWKKAQKLIDQGYLMIDGNSVDSADVVAVARFVTTFVLLKTTGDLI